MRRKSLVSLAVLTMVLLLTSTAFAAGPTKTLRYCLWDQNQAPAYQTILDNFSKENPGVNVQLELLPWGDYWTKLTTEVAGGDAPDLITMFVVQFKTLQSKGVFVPINDFIKRDKVDMTKYNASAVDTFKIGGKMYGLPKDFDTQAIFYNKDLLQKAGYSQYPTDLTWDPVTGGSYVKFLQSLTVDKNGKHPNESGFDPRDIVQYGLLPVDRTFFPIDGPVATFAAANGGKIYNPNTGALTFDERKTLESLKYWWNMFNKWYVCPPISVIATTGAEAMFYSQIGATWVNGPWMTLAINDKAGFKWGIARNPKGPIGQSVTRANSLVDVIYQGSKYKEEAWKLLKYIATKPGQDILGETGTVIPAYSDSSPKYLDYYKGKGLDASIFVDAYHGNAVFPLNLVGYAKAEDIAQRNFALAFDGLGYVSMDSAVAKILQEANPDLIKANAK